MSAEKYLLLIRHAEAQEDLGEIPDTERSLTSRGLLQLQIQGVRITQFWQPDRLVASHAVRARDSALRLAPYWNLEPGSVQQEALIYEARGAEELLQWLRGWEPASQCLALVGHNPLLNDLLQMLMACPSPAFPKGAVAGLKLPVADWSELQPGMAELCFFLLPSANEDKVRRYDLERRLLAHIWRFVSAYSSFERPDNLRKIVYKQATRMARKFDPLLPARPVPQLPAPVRKVRPARKSGQSQ